MCESVCEKTHQIKINTGNDLQIYLNVCVCVQRTLNDSLGVHMTLLHGSDMQILYFTIFIIKKGVVSSVKVELKPVSPLRSHIHMRRTLKIYTACAK